LQTTKALADLVAEVCPGYERGQHPATRVFQAIRIAINDELGEIERALKASLECVAIGGRLVVISFHSLEDRIVKRFFRDQARGAQLPRRLPVTGAATSGVRLKLIGGAVKPSAAEIAANPRSRSAVMRVAEKVA
jgi:16S rRNA (cytosine1402-N4)-methyltransferase